MGTHPIFESDFDCLTEMFSRFAARATRTFVRPPVQVYGLSGSYASATYSAAVKSDAQADVAADMVTLAKVFENEKIADFFADPFVSASDKMDAIQAVGGLSDITINLFAAMSENNRLALVAAAIAGLLKSGESADISVSVNPELLGGMIVSVGDKYTEMKSIDMSVLTKVKKYSDLLNATA